MRVLLVEDDEALRETLAQALARLGHGVDPVGDGHAADAALQAGAYDLVVLDLGLPRTDGIEVLRRLRGRRVATPVLILSARAGIDERVLGLKTGADDYLCKPFDLAELEARVQALLRRAGGGLPSLAYGPLTLDLEGRVAFIDGVAADFTPREYAILEALLGSVGKVVVKKRLSQQLGDWGGEVGTGSIEVYIHRLRKRLAPSGIRIETIHGLGYLLRPLD
jgi:two-component system, OmpR family, response regulator